MVSLNTPNPSESSGTTVAHDAFLSGAKREDVPNARVVSVAQPAPSEFGVGIMSDLIFKLTVNQLCSVIRQRGVDRESETMLGMLESLVIAGEIALPDFMERVQNLFPHIFAQIDRSLIAKLTEAIKD